MNMIGSKWQLRASMIRWSLLLVPLLVLLGVVSSSLSGAGADQPWFADLRKPAIYPPAWTFGAVWTVLYAMMGIAMAMIASAHGARGRGIAALVFVIQLALNLAWSPVFFGAHQITASLVVIAALDVAVLLAVVLFWRVRPVAGLLLLPYLAWVLFATVLNWQICELNPDMDGRETSGAVQRVEF